MYMYVIVFTGCYVVAIVADDEGESDIEEMVVYTDIADDSTYLRRPSSALSQGDATDCPSAAASTSAPVHGRKRGWLPASFPESPDLTQSDDQEVNACFH